MKSLLRAGMLLAAVSLFPALSGAQGSKPEFLIGAGAAFPTGTFGDRNDVGYSINVGVGMNQRGSPMGFRAEGLYTEYNYNNGGNRKSHAGGVMANAVLDLTQGSHTTTNSLYAIGGLGYYSTLEQFTVGNVSQSSVGWNLGGGFRFPLSGFSAYIEARYHSVSNTDIRFVPVMFGLAF
jgi:hypothetical protein